MLGKRRPQLLVWAAVARPGADDWRAGQGRFGAVDVAAYTRPQWRLARLRVPAHWCTIEAKGRMRRARSGESGSWGAQRTFLQPLLSL